jgi:two-component system nitrogen regulation sensor histidine kinase NtrY
MIPHCCARAKMCAGADGWASTMAGLKILMKFLKKQNILIISIAGLFILYFSAIIYYSFKVETIALFQSVSENNYLLYLLAGLFLIILALVLYYIIQIVTDRIRKKEGSRFRLRLTLFFLLITSIPLIPLSIISNNWISKSINLWFFGGVEESLYDAVEITRELYRRLAEESVREWEAQCVGCTLDDIRKMHFQNIDGVFSLDTDNESFESLSSSSDQILSDIKGLNVTELNLETWKRINVKGREYLLIPVLGQKQETRVLVRVIPDFIMNKTNSISTGLQSYRTFKVIREPIKGKVILFYIVVTMPFVLLSFYLALVVSRDVTLPIRELVIGTQKVARDELNYKVEIRAKDEWNLLIDSFNRMTEELRLNKELLKYAERSAAWQDIARKIAHEIKNPLTPIKLSAERVLRQYRKNDQYREILAKGIETIITEVNNITYMVNEFSSFARFPSSKLEKNDIIQLLEDIYRFLQDTYKDIEFSFSCKEDHVYIQFDKYQVRRAFLNILYNSIHAVSEGGRIWIEAYSSPGKEDHFTVAISDNGFGIEDEIKDKIFKPYFSKDGKGSGLGLAIVERIIYENKGRIWFESAPGQTSFYMEFAKA